MAQLLQSTIRGGVLQASGGLVDLNASAAGYFGAIGNPTYPTNAQVANFVALFPSQLQGAAQLFVPFYLGNTRNYFGVNATDRLNNNVTRTGYEEKYLVDYNNLNAKFVGGLHYKITNNLEASWNSYIGSGTTVYTGADRYSLKNLKMAQHKLELRSKSWFVRAYTTQENAGESYNASAAGAFLNGNRQLLLQAWAYRVSSLHGLELTFLLIQKHCANRVQVVYLPATLRFMPTPVLLLT